MYKNAWCKCKVVVLRNKPIAFLTSSALPSPSSLLKLPIVGATHAAEDSPRSWRYCVVAEWDLTAEPSPATQATPKIAIEFKLTKFYGLYPSHDALQVLTLLGVVASVCTPRQTRTQQLPPLVVSTMLGIVASFCSSVVSTRINC